MFVGGEMKAIVRKHKDETRIMQGELCYSCLACFNSEYNEERRTEYSIVGVSGREVPSKSYLLLFLSVFQAELQFIFR